MRNCWRNQNLTELDLTGQGKEPRLNFFRYGRWVSGDELDLRRLGHCDASERGSDDAGLPAAATTTSRACLRKLGDHRNRDRVQNSTRIPNDDNDDEVAVMVPRSCCCCCCVRYHGSWCPLLSGPAHHSSRSRAVSEARTHHNTRKRSWLAAASNMLHSTDTLPTITDDRTPAAASASPSHRSRRWQRG